MGTDVAHLNRMGPHTEIDCLINATRTHADDDLLLLIAFDGVLVDYAGDPLHVRIPPKRLALLRQVQRGSRVVVGVISGRPLQDLRSRIPLGDEAAYVGLHGLEIAMLRCGWSGLEKMDDFQFIARQLAVQLHKSVGDVPGEYTSSRRARSSRSTRAKLAEKM